MSEVEQLRARAHHILRLADTIMDDAAARALRELAAEKLAAAESLVRGAGQDEAGHEQGEDPGGRR